jgi:hypothetical protein
MQIAGLIMAIISVAVIIGGCAAESDESSVELDQLLSIAASGQIDGTQLESRVFDDPGELWEAVRGTDYAKGWKGGYRAQYVDIVGGIQRVEVQVDVYKSKSAAQKRLAAERQLTEDFLKQRLSADVVVEEFDDATNIESCDAFSIKHGAIVPQYEVYCREGTAVIYAKAISTNEANAIGLAIRLASGITEALQAATPAESS